MRDSAIREQFERSAELAQAGPNDAYARRWSVAHERMAEAAVASRISDGPEAERRERS